MSDTHDEATTTSRAPTHHQRTSSVASPIRVGQAGQTTPTTLTAAFAATSAIRFLAPDLFSELRLQIPRLEWDVPADIALHLGGRQQIHDVTVAFLRLTRPWMPVVSGKRHLAAVLNPLLAPLQRPRALLTLCMKLCCLSVDDRIRNEGRHPLYLLVKQIYAEVERVEEPCLEVMQAALFIAVFEMGDAIYPAAHLTVGALIRYGIAMGMDKINLDRMGAGAAAGATAGASWLDIEEMRRVWWGALILDRLLNVSHPSWSLASADPVFEDFLPVDDESFHNATSTPEDATRISEAFGFKLGSYAPLSPSSDAVQLCRTLEALVRANEFEVTTRKLAFCSQSTISYIGVLLLQEHHWEETSLDFTPGAKRNAFTETHSALETLDRISMRMRGAGHGGQRDLESGHCTPFFVDLVYRALSALMVIGRGQDATDMQDKKESLKWLLSHTRKRWPLVGVYEKILAVKEAMAVAEAASG
ncbi:hypothetical protein QQS21_008969 [Conoideocrella luteorostrata]|uniref:Xylanolytic transcriptional activator regulatory domain-containing protein n=1 Tax=Conoideocrella luteorostrata TaxID=1105319 RepID=A0AAJ0CHV6_9HYPO|nr:hypothetical protein QQS21_008969 [Conoideocrella luteorostrata]